MGQLLDKQFSYYYDRKRNSYLLSFCLCVYTYKRKCLRANKSTAARKQNTFFNLDDIVYCVVVSAAKLYNTNRTFLWNLREIEAKVKNVLRLRERNSAMCANNNNNKKNIFYRYRRLRILFILRECVSPRIVYQNIIIYFFVSLWLFWCAYSIRIDLIFTFPYFSFLVLIWIFFSLLFFCVFFLTFISFFRRSPLIYVSRRSCIRRGGSCDHRRNDCCFSSSCRCNLWGSNCRCHRAGLFQKWG